MPKDNLAFKGYVHLQVIDSDGNVKETRSVNNVVTDAGKEYITNRMTSSSTNLMSHMAIGSSSTAASSSDTTLPSEIARVGLTSSISSGNEITYVANFVSGTPSGTVSVSGAAIFNAASGGIMLCSVRFNTVTKEELDTISTNWIVTAG